MKFVSSPYSHKNKKVREERVYLTKEFCYNKIKNGQNVLSPIVYGQTILDDFELPNTWEFWKKFCLEFLEICDGMYVLMFEGWEESEGVQSEIKRAKELELEIEYLNIKINK